MKLTTPALSNPRAFRPATTEPPFVRWGLITLVLAILTVLAAKLALDAFAQAS